MTQWAFLSVYRYFCLILAVCGITKKKQLLERTILKIPKFWQISGGCYQQNPPTKVDDSVTKNL
jgi:hypothetical protein